MRLLYIASLLLDMFDNFQFDHSIEQLYRRYTVVDVTKAHQPYHHTSIYQPCIFLTFTSIAVVSIMSTVQSFFTKQSNNCVYLVQPNVFLTSILVVRIQFNSASFNLVLQWRHPSKHCFWVCTSVLFLVLLH